MDGLLEKVSRCGVMPPSPKGTGLIGQSPLEED
jgi:hypothetical protein